MKKLLWLVGIVALLSCPAAGQAIGNGNNFQWRAGSVTMVAGAATVTFSQPFPNGTTVIVGFTPIGAAPQALGVPDEVHITATPTVTGFGIAASSTSDVRVVQYQAFTAQ